jgi:hypothetical protein
MPGHALLCVEYSSASVRPLPSIGVHGCSLPQLLADVFVAQYAHDIHDKHFAHSTYSMSDVSNIAHAVALLCDDAEKMLTLLWKAAEPRATSGAYVIECSRACRHGWGQYSCMSFRRRSSCRGGCSPSVMHQHMIMKPSISLYAHTYMRMHTYLQMLMQVQKSLIILRHMCNMTIILDVNMCMHKEMEAGAGSLDRVPLHRLRKTSDLATTLECGG